MRLSYKWLCELCGFTPDPKQLGDRLTFSGLEVDELRHVGANLAQVVVGRVTSRERHPERDKLFNVTIDVGRDEEIPVVCGAPNTPDSGGTVVLALPGARVGEILVEPRELAGSRSEGMVCSELELDIGPDHEGILLLDGVTDAAPGTPIADALELDDWIIELGVTPNRPDALSMRGLAREVCVLYDQPFAPPEPTTTATGGPPAGELATVELLDASACPRYMGAVLTGLEVRPSPFKLRYRLHNLGMRPISNLVDVTNLILLEYGQPLHAFDLDRLAGQKIVVRKAAPGEKMVTLDEAERSFTEHDLLICDAERPVAVAGVMGGEQAGICDQTRNLLIECAYFTPSNIRRTSKRLKLSSESSYRFERGVDPNHGPSVLAAASALSVELAGGVAAPGLIDEYPEPISRPQVFLRPSRYEQIIGATVAPTEMRRILTGLGAEVGGTDVRLQVDVPTARPDIEREIDLIEEIARVVGFDVVEPQLPRIQCSIPDREDFESERRAKEVLASLGLDEAISYSFVPEAALAVMGLDRQLVRIANPLNSKRSTMRTTLLAGLLENLRRAVTRFVPAFRQFEVARTFHDEGQELPRETLRAAGLLSGPRDGWIGEKPEPLDFYDAKGLVTSFVLELTGRAPVLEPVTDLGYLHPTRALEVRVGGEVVGVVGEIHPVVLAHHKLQRGAAGFELSVSELWSARTRSRALAIPEYPPMVRDVALMIDEQLDAAPVREALQRACGELAVEVRLFDVYRGKGVEPGKKSLAFSVVYRAADRTLTDEEVDALHRAAVEEVKAAHKAVVR
ncbi:MAG: phenylalanine--tRNA ligase subunit beta [Deltaproteobacteria bacterium]|nr:phenylalanine--tRNA ligase subunit beta [Deltaproteobacteria bacterium]